MAARDLLDELIASATPPLSFLSRAAPEQRARTRLPVDAWLAKLAAVRREASGGAESDLEDRVEELAVAVRGIASEDDARRVASVEAALAALDRLRATPAGGVSIGEPDAPTAHDAARRDPAAAAGVRGERSRAAAHQDAAGEAGPVLDLAQLEARLRALSGAVSSVRGVGPARAAELEKFGIHSVEDLLYHLPFRYDDRRAMSKVAELVVGTSASAVVSIEGVAEPRVGRARRQVLSAIARDETGFLELVWYHQIRFFRSRIAPGSRWIVHGRIEPGYDAARRIVHPELERAEEAEAVGTGAPRLVPVYEKPTQMPAAAMRRIVHAAVEAYAESVPDARPPAVRRRFALEPLGAALRAVHQPAADAGVAELNAFRSRAHRSIVFDELFFVQLGLLLRKARVAREPGIAFSGPGELVRRLLGSLPFALTSAQRRVIAEIEADMARPQPMHRLLQGDVGSGKTVVAVAAALRAIEAGYQAAIMAPTELLAEQHWQTVQRIAAGLDVRLWYLTGDATAADRRAVMPRMAAGEPGLAVGTHALIQEEVVLGKLGLAVIDEQHRFGVMQRAALSQTGQGALPDVLLMTATPIPRTLALSVYGDLDLSFLDELPPGRKPVVTRLFAQHQRPRAYELVQRELAAGRQAYVVYPLIEESEKTDLRDATSAARELRESIFPEFRVALIHGRMPSAERDSIMRDFKAGRYQVLVSTTVIEVGIDVPNASIIMIEHAERFGLAQLHQLRGRVGRGSDAAFCLLVADYAQSKEARERLRVMTQTRDGMKIAEADLEIRGPGALLGTRQAGLPDFRVANLLRDASVLREARAAAEDLLARDPELVRPESAATVATLRARWVGRLGLARVG